MKNYIMLAAFIFSALTLAAVKDVNTLDIQEESNRQTIMATDFDPEEIVSKSSMEIKINTLHKEIQYLSSTINDTIESTPFVVSQSERIATEKLNNKINEIVNDIFNLKSQINFLAMYDKSEELSSNDFAMLPPFEFRSGIYAWQMNEKLNSISNQLLAIRELLHPNKSSCKDYYDQDNSVVDGHYILKDLSGNYFGVLCRFEGGNAYTLTAVLNQGPINTSWAYDGAHWQNNDTSVNTQLLPDFNSSLKTKSWTQIQGDSFIIIRDTTKIATISGFGVKSMGEIFSAPDRTPCTATQHITPNTYIPNSGWGPTYQTCYLNYWKYNHYPFYTYPGNAGSIGRMRLLLQYSGTLGSSVHNTARYHWNSTRFIGGYHAATNNGDNTFRFDNLEFVDWQSVEAKVYLYIKDN